MMTKLPQFMISVFWLLAGVSAAVSITVPTSAQASQSRCASLLDPSVVLESFNEDFISANEIAITGDFIYPVKMVLKNLGIKSVRVRSRYQGLKVLTIGEGVSHFLPYLLDRGVSVQAMDVWYHKKDFQNNFTGDLMRAYLKKYAKHLVPGDAEHLPFDNGSMDKIFSHMLVNNVTIESQKKILAEVIRVLKPGGEARIFGFDDDEAKELKAFFSEHYGDQVRFTFKKRTYTLNFRANHNTRSSKLLVLNKLPQE